MFLWSNFILMTSVGINLYFDLKFYPVHSFTLFHIFNFPLGFKGTKILLFIFFKFESIPNNFIIINIIFM